MMAKTDVTPQGRKGRQVIGKIRLVAATKGKEAATHATSLQGRDEQAQMPAHATATSLCDMEHIQRSRAVFLAHRTLFLQRRTAV